MPPCTCNFVRRDWELFLVALYTCNPTYHMNKQIARVLLGLCLGVTTLFLTTNRLIAQTWPGCPGCPTDAPPTSVGWSGSGSYTTTMSFDGVHVCTVHVCYCTRTTSTGNNDYTVTAVMISPAGCQGTATTAVIIDDVFKDMKDNNRMGFPCPPCPNTTNYWREVRAGCWNHFVDPNTGIDVWEICATHKWCMTPFQICCDPVTGQRHEIQGATVVVGTCDPDCEPANCPGN